MTAIMNMSYGGFIFVHRTTVNPNRLNTIWRFQIMSVTLTHYRDIDNLLA